MFRIPWPPARPGNKPKFELTEKISISFPKSMQTFNKHRCLIRGVGGSRDCFCGKYKRKGKISLKKLNSGRDFGRFFGEEQTKS